LPSPSEIPVKLRAAQALFFLNAAIWLVFGFVTVGRMAGRDPAQAMTTWVVAILMVGNAGAMLISGWGLGRHRKWFYYLAIAVLVVNIILTLTDQFGPLDLATLIIDLVAFGLLMASWHHYLGHPVEAGR